MKHITLTILASCVISMGSASAQFKNGKICHPFTCSEVQGGFWSLYDTLDKGIAVVGFYFDESSEIAWDYHQTNALQIFHNLHHNAQNNDAQVIGFGALSNAGLEGTTETTQGNWLETMNYYVTDPLAVSLGNCPGIASFVSPNPYWEIFNNVFLICPDRRIYLLGLPTPEALEAAMDMCNKATEPHDAEIAYIMADTLASCAGQPRPAKVIVCNLGTSPLTSCDVVVAEDGQPKQTYHWEGNLPTYHLDTIDFGSWATDGTASSVRFYTQSPNGIVDQKPENDSLGMLLEHATYFDSDTIYVEVQADGYGHQIYWDIKDATGVTIDSGGNESVPVYNANIAGNSQNQYQDFEYELRPVATSGFASECMTVRVLSGMGYGTCCTWGNGYIRFKKGDETIFEFKDFGRRAFGRLTTTLVGTEDASSISRLKAYPNPTESDMTLSFHLETSAIVAVEVYNSVGEQVYDAQQSYTSGAQQHTLQTGSWPVGLYFATLRDAAGGVQSVRFVVAR